MNLHALKSFPPKKGEREREANPTTNLKHVFLILPSPTQILSARLYLASVDASFFRVRFPVSCIKTALNTAMLFKGESPLASFISIMHSALSAFCVSQDTFSALDAALLARSLSPPRTAEKERGFLLELKKNIRGNSVCHTFLLFVVLSAADAGLQCGGGGDRRNRCDKTQEFVEHFLS